MMKNTLAYILFLVVQLVFCQSNQNDLKLDEQHKFIPGDYFENEQAEDFNEQGIEMTKKGDFKNGKAFFLKSLEIEPNNPTALSNLGLNRYLDRDYENAKKFYQLSYKISDSTYHIAAVT